MRRLTIKRATVLMLAFIVPNSSMASACQLEDFALSQPSWKASIDSAADVFIGEVVAIKASRQSGGEKRVLFRVDVPIKGVAGERFEAPQGSGGDCGIQFSVGDVVIFAGDFVNSPTVFLADPPTREQKMQLGYLKQMLRQAGVDPRSKR